MPDWEQLHGFQEELAFLGEKRQKTARGIISMTLNFNPISTRQDLKIKKKRKESILAQQKHVQIITESYCLPLTCNDCCLAL